VDDGPITLATVCGIAAIVDYSAPPDARLAERIRDAMVHRGPDQAGLYSDDQAALAMRRLAIIDVAGGDQPITNEDGSIIVVLNGEIYNFGQLRDDLIRRGHRFSTASDTEVLVHLYEDEGDDLVHRLRGMFAFALWDSRRRRLLCARDRLGKKPLFWRRWGDRVTLASELSALLVDPSIPREIDQRALDAFLCFQYVPAPLCIVSGVQKLPPASRLIFDDEGARVERWWRLAYEPKLTGLAFRDAQERVWEMIKEATRIRLISEVPLGAFLSGGVDSSAVVAAMAEVSSSRVKTFSITFEETDFDEATYARMVAERFATDHHEFHVRPDALAMMPRLARHYGEPFADPSAIPSFYLADQASAHVTVALNGDGGDECFAGYGRYLRRDRARWLDHVPRRMLRTGARATSAIAGKRDGGMGRVAYLARMAALEPQQLYATAVTAFDAATRRDLVVPEMREELGGWAPEDLLFDAWDEVPAADRTDRMLGADIETYLPGDLLPKMDIATMAHSLEARSPLLDHELMEFAARLPTSDKIHAGEGKSVLRRAMRGKLPDEVLDRPKMGFGVPLKHWFRGALAELPREMLLDPAALTARMLRREQVQRLIDDHLRGTQDHSLRLWVLLQLESWCREVLNTAARSVPV
jgi:asparagine synthase (glutamine-hydrolysing)